MLSSPLHVWPRVLALFVIILASFTIIVSLLTTQYYPNRFRIHPLPYLSDAGLRDPERYILSLGLAISAAVFVPFAIALHLYDKTVNQRAAQLELISGLCVSLSLNIFTTVPGWWIPHHIFAGVFAGSAATWSACHTRVSSWRDGWTARTRLLHMLTFLQIAVIVTFAITWGSVKLQIPYKMIPNRDPRFIVLAIGEYIGTTAFLSVLYIASRPLKFPLTIQLGSGHDKYAV